MMETNKAVMSTNKAVAVARTSRAIEERPEKIHSRHLERLAMVYVRQSSMQQVRRNQESTKLQYSLVDAAQQLGWPRDRIVVIDDDLGVSGSSAVGRKGFQRLLSEVALDHVGVILGVEMSRLARSNKDWHQLLELCARFSTLIADLDGLYDPSRYNDRLLLGLKGTMSEAELHILRQRLWQGKLQKARRGELTKPVPAGYLLQSSGEVIFDPDEEARAVVQLIFEEFERIGTLHGLLKHLVKNRVQIGVRRRTRPDIGKLEWRRPQRGMLGDMLRNPIYAGAYVYGRRRTDPRRQKPGRPATGKTPLLPADQWHVCIPDRLPAYISWERYDRNQRQLMANRATAETRGTIRAGSALLQGLIVCGRCTRRMNVQYGSRGQGAWSRYVCAKEHLHYGTGVCQGLSGPRLDELVSELVLEALMPSALEVSLKASEEIEQKRERETELWQKRIERTKYESQRAERQYNAVEPENRLVARTLEQNWEEKLKMERAVQEEYHRLRERQPQTLSDEDRDSIRALANDLPALWRAPTTTVSDRKSILRLLIDQVEVTVEGNTEWVAIVVRWAGGHETARRFRRPVANLTQLESHKDLLTRMKALRLAGYSCGEIADKLNSEGWLTATQRNSFNDRLVRSLIARHLPSVAKGPRRSPSEDPNEWWLKDLADHLKIPLPTFYSWMRRGWLRAKRARGKWIVIADDAEMDRLCHIRQGHPTPNNRG